jgi:hypothetical protein
MMGAPPLPPLGVFAGAEPIAGGPAILAAACAFWLAMIVHCALREPDRSIWFAVLGLMNVFGAAAYFGLRFVPRVFGRKIAASRRRRRDIERVEAELARFPRAYLYGRLGELHLEGGSLDDAERALERALAMEPGAVEHRYHLGRVALGRGDLARAIERLAGVVAADDGFAYGEAKRLLARAYLEAGRDADARPVLESLLKTHPSAEARYRYASLLAKAGETEAARRELARVIDEARGTPHFTRAREQPWAAAARSLLRKLG